MRLTLPRAALLLSLKPSPTTAFSLPRTNPPNLLQHQSHHRFLSSKNTLSPPHIPRYSSLSIFRRHMSSSTEQPSYGNTIALLQFNVTPNKSINHETAKRNMDQAVAQGAKLLVLPEIWNSPYATDAFGEYAESLPSLGYEYTQETKDEWSNSPSVQVLFEAAIGNSVYIVGGSIPELDGGKLYNTCLCISPDGEVVGKHRKVHLFDIDVPGGIRFKESDTLSPGDVLTSFVAGDLGRVGVGICYDIRFPEYALLLNQQTPLNILIYPGAFNMTTGPAHWELLQRARAIDNQCFVATASPARTEETPGGKYKHYTAWGHSTVVDPWGEVVAKAGAGEEIVVCDLNLDRVEEVRSGVPIRNQKRVDMYKLSSA